MADFDGKVALVTGASRGIGKGVATVLADAGVTVYATGRTMHEAPIDRPVRCRACDQANHHDVTRLFARIHSEPGRLDILVNSAWGGYEQTVEDGAWRRSSATASHGA